VQRSKGVIFAFVRHPFQDVESETDLDWRRIWEFWSFPAVFRERKI
jgi:hypothetical protein